MYHTKYGRKKGERERERERERELVGGASGRVLYLNTVHHNCTTTNGL